MQRILVFFSHIFTEPALREVQRRHPSARLERMLGHRVAVFLYPGTFSQFVQPWLERPPVYIHHALPVLAPDGIRAAGSLTSTGESLGAHVLCPDTHEPLADEQNRLRKRLRGRGRRLSERIHDSILTLVPDGSGSYFMCKHSARENLTPWSDGIPRFTEKTLNRSGPKLLEALSLLPVHPTPGDRALDLGCGMGSWTRILRERGLIVYSVDQRLPVRPLREDPGVHFHRASAEAYLQRAPRNLNLIVNDMIMDAQDSARLMTTYAKYLAPHGRALMTLKLRPRNRNRVLDHSLRILRGAYRITHLRQLYMNKNEMTALLRPRREK